MGAVRTNVFIVPVSILCLCMCRVSDFEYTRECIVFDLLNIQLYHGWLVDPQDQAQVCGSIMLPILV